MAGVASGARVIRELNERAVLTELRRRGEASKAEIADSLGLSTNTVGAICAALQRRGLVAPGPKRQGLRGQPATPLVLDPKGAYAIGIKLGRRTQHAVLVDFAGRTLAARARVLDLPAPDEALALVAQDIAAFRAKLPKGAAARLTGIGIAIPTNLDRWRRELGIPDAIGEAWAGCDLGAELAAVTDRPVLIENDGTAAVAAELYQGCGRSLDDFALLHVGAALGGGLVLEGIVHAGRSGNAADFGLMPTAPSRLASAPQPPAGLPDILLNRASINALIRHLRSGGIEARLSTDLESSCALRPDLVEEWLEDCAEALVRPIFTIASLLDLQAVVLDGLLPPELTQRLRERLDVKLHAAAPESRPPPPIVLGTCGRDAAATGAAFLLFERSFGPVARTIRRAPRATADTRIVADGAERRQPLR